MPRSMDVVCEQPPERIPLGASYSIEGIDLDDILSVNPLRDSTMAF